MFSYSLRIRKDRAVYGPGQGLRYITAFFLVLLSYAMVWNVATSGFDVTYIAPICIIVLLLLTALYRDEWIFDNAKKEVVIVFGLGPFVSRRRIPYSMVKRLEISHFLKGIPDDSKVATKPSWRHPAMIVLSLRLKDKEDSTLDLEITSERRNGMKLEREASRLSAFSGLDYKVDRESYHGRRF